MTDNIPIPKKAFLARAGGKRLLASKLISLFPNNYEDMLYVEPFVGGGSIFFKKQMSITEIINDLDLELYIMLSCIKERDINNEINRTRISREYFNAVLKNSNDPVKMIEKYNNSFRTAGKNWCIKRRETDKINMDFSIYTKRLKNVEIYNEDFKIIIDRYNTENSFFYLDPPYSVEKICKNPYENYVSPTEVYNAVKNIKGYFMLSYNNTTEIKELFKDYNIIEVETLYKRKYNNLKVIELVITNY